MNHNEPVLATQAIQGMAVPGFFKSYQSLVLVGVPQEKAEAFRDFVAGLEISSAADALADRRWYRDNRAKVAQARAEAAFAPDEAEPSLLTGRPLLRAIAFTYDGLLQFVPSASQMRSPAFRQGMARRAGLLGDGREPTDPGHPSNWLYGGPSLPLSALIVVAGDSRRRVRHEAQEMRDFLEAQGITAVIEHGGVNPDRSGHEHFGFHDGVSQPGIRGVAQASSASDFITPRHPTVATPAARLQGYPGQSLVWPGEFVFGYASTSPDPLVPGPISSEGPSWSINGAYLVLRRLKQDVAGFWNEMSRQSQKLQEGHPSLGKLDPERLAALLVGRWPDGTPVQSSPDKADPELARDEHVNNDFQFDRDTPARAAKGAHTATTRHVPADPLGTVCPWAAHIRKVNPRDAATDLGGASETLARRILRVGIPYGDFVGWNERFEAHEGDRGLLFMSIQTSIEEQFEFLQARWMNDAMRPRAPGGHDMIAGQLPPSLKQARRCTFFDASLRPAEVQLDQQFVTMTGGAYFFLPSLPALREVICPTGENEDRPASSAHELHPRALRAARSAAA